MELIGVMASGQLIADTKSGHALLRDRGILVVYSDFGFVDEFLVEDKFLSFWILDFGIGVFYFAIIKKHLLFHF